MGSLYLPGFCPDAEGGGGGGGGDGASWVRKFTFNPPTVPASSAQSTGTVTYTDGDSQAVDVVAVRVSANTGTVTFDGSTGAVTEGTGGNSFITSYRLSDAAGSDWAGTGSWGEGNLGPGPIAIHIALTDYDPVADDLYVGISTGDNNNSNNFKGIILRYASASTIQLRTRSNSSNGGVWQTFSTTGLFTECVVTLIIDDGNIVSAQFTEGTTTPPTIDKTAARQVAGSVTDGSSPVYGTDLRVIVSPEGDAEATVELVAVDKWE